MDFKVGFNGFVFKAFQLKLNSLAEAERCCTICIDEMSIKSALFYSLPLVFTMKVMEINFYRHSLYWLLWLEEFIKNLNNLYAIF
jgi:hypothetical protein